MHNRVGLDMEVSQHGVRSPPADELDGIGVDLAVEEGGGTGGSERAGGNVRWEEAGGVANGSAGGTEQRGNNGGG